MKHLSFYTSQTHGDRNGLSYVCEIDSSIFIKIYRQELRSHRQYNIFNRLNAATRTMYACIVHYPERLVK